MSKHDAHLNGSAPRTTATTWLSMKDASELTGRTREYLLDQIAAGGLSARTIRRGDKVEYRLTRGALAEAALIGVPPRLEVAPREARPEPTPDTFTELIALIREQNQRIASLEDQRAQLAARLGATVEAMHQLEDRLESILEARPSPPPAQPVDTGRPLTTDDGLVLASTPPADASAHSPGAIIGSSDADRSRQLIGVRRSLSRLVREIAQPRLRELTGGSHRGAASGD